MYFHEILYLYIFSKICTETTRFIKLWQEWPVLYINGVPRGGFGCSNTPPEIPKALQNRTKLNPILKTVKHCWI